MNHENARGRRVASKVRLTAIAAAIAGMSSVGVAHAFQIDVGNDDLAVRWDNTVKYNLADRVNKQNDSILKSPNNDDGDRNFNKGIVSNRIDVLSEFDVVYQKRYGFRVSAAGWYDWAYNNLDNTSVGTENTLQNGRPVVALSPFTNRYNKGLSGEILDAFVFGGFDIGQTNLNFKLGQHTTFWGEAVFNPIHSLSYGQNPIDLRKGIAVPGTEAKELFVPRNSISASLVATPELSFQAQYFLDWNPIRIPDSGSYLGGFDMLLAGGDSLIAGPGQRLTQGTPVDPKKNGDWGINSRWSPSWLDGTLGFYYRNTSDIQPQLHLMPAVAALPAAACQRAGLQPLNAATCYVNPGAANLAAVQQGLIGQYLLVTPSNIDIFGISLSKNIEGISVGAELNYRHNMPLVSDPVNILPAQLAAISPGAVSAIPEQGKTGGALGNTVHGVFNLIGTVPGTALFDALSWATELQWNYWSSISQGEQVFKGRGSYVGIDKVTKNFFGMNANVTPTWFQVFPGVDLSLPVTLSYGLYGNSAVASGGNEGAGTFSAGVGADVYQKYRFDLKYSDYFGPTWRNGNGSIQSAAGLNALIQDRGFVSLTFKTTF